MENRGYCGDGGWIAVLELKVHLFPVKELQVGKKLANFYLLGLKFIRLYVTKLKIPSNFSRYTVN